jgi:hypothetical protein
VNEHVRTFKWGYNTSGEGANENTRALPTLCTITLFPIVPRPILGVPRELFLGRKADAKRDFKCAFGDFVQSTVPETNNSMSARTEDCVVMLPTRNRTGSVRMVSLPAVLGNPVGHDVMGGAPRHDDDSGHHSHPTNANYQPVLERADDIGGVGHDSGGDQEGRDDAGGDSGGDVRGDNEGRSDIRGDTGGRPESGDHTHTPGVHHEEELPGASAPARPNTPGARVLDFFRQGGTDLALISKEVMETAEVELAINITVRDAIHTRGEEAERVIMKELS